MSRLVLSWRSYASTPPSRDGGQSWIKLESEISNQGQRARILSGSLHYCRCSTLQFSSHREELVNYRKSNSPGESYRGPGFHHPLHRLKRKEETNQNIKQNVKRDEKKIGKQASKNDQPKQCITALSSKILATAIPQQLSQI